MGFLKVPQLVETPGGRALSRKLLISLLVHFYLISTAFAVGGPGQDANQSPSGQNTQTSSTSYPNKPINMLVAYAPMP